MNGLKNKAISNPRNFNDPLDCNPTIKADTNREELEKLCFHMLSVTYDKVRANNEIQNFQYLSSEYGDYRTNPEGESGYIQMLKTRVKEVLDLEMEAMGVFSMAEKWNCPLMWSHYANEHKGICIEYDMTGKVVISP